MNFKQHRIHPALQGNISDWNPSSEPYLVYQHPPWSAAWQLDRVLQENAAMAEPSQASSKPTITSIPAQPAMDPPRKVSGNTREHAPPSAAHTLPKP